MKRDLDENAIAVSKHTDFGYKLTHLQYVPDILLRYVVPLKFAYGRP